MFTLRIEIRLLWNNTCPLFKARAYLRLKELGQLPQIAQELAETFITTLADQQDRVLSLTRLTKKQSLE